MLTRDSEHRSTLQNSEYTHFRVTFQTKGALAVATLFYKHAFLGVWRPYFLATYSVKCD